LVAGQRWRGGVFSIYLHTNLALGDYEFAPGRAGIATSLWSWLQEAFLSVLRYQAEPLGELSTPPFFLFRWGWLWLRSKLVRGLSSASAPTEAMAMALEVFVSPLLVFRVDPPLVFGADIIKLSLVTIITVSVLKLPNYLQL